MSTQLNRDRKLIAERNRLIEYLWASDPNQTAKQVWQKLAGGQLGISLRTVQLVLKKFRNLVRSLPEFPYENWTAWEDSSESPEDTEFLLAINQVCSLTQYRDLYKHEAKWGHNLRKLLDDMNRVMAFYFVKEYAAREVAGYRLGKPNYTQDMDAFLTHHAWKPETAPTYAPAVFFTIVPPPMLFPWLPDSRSVSPKEWVSLALKSFAIPQHLPPPPDHIKARGPDAAEVYYDMLLNLSDGQEQFY